MEVEIKLDCTGVDWKAVSETLKRVGMAYCEPDMHRRAFEASHTTVFVYHAEQLIGFGRAISDGVYQAAVYDCAVLPEFPRQRDRKDYHEQYLIPALALQHHSVRLTRKRRFLSDTYSGR